MGRVRKKPAGHRGGDTTDWHGSRGSDDNRWGKVNPEDDPLRDLRPDVDDMPNAAGDEYMWPDTSNEFDEDD